MTDETRHMHEDRERAVEQELVAKSQRGDRDAFNRLVERHQAGAYAVALRMLGDPDVAADVTQDAFFSAYRALGSFKGTSFRAWLFRIVSNGCYDYWRTQKRRPSTSLEATLEGEREGDVSQGGDAHVPTAMIDASADPERLALRAEMIEHIEKALLKLPPEQRLALILSDIQGLSYDEIARVMETSLGTVKSRIARGRGHLRDLLARQGELFGQARRPGSGRTNE
ncbi:MAG: sigma-70 family RNA polymerase sigma factor [Ktedonobacterales bacterium]